MKAKILLFFFLGMVANGAYAQDDSPYKTSLLVDGPVIAVGSGLSYLGLKLMQDKDGISQEEAMNLRKEDVNGFDRFAAGNFDPDAKKISDYPFYGSFGLPLLLVLNENVRSKAGQMMVLYIETMAVTGALFTMTNGNVKRLRPLAYGENTPLHEKIRGNATNSFYAGHTAATASATFFVAKVFHDFNPDSEARPYIWAAAAAIPAGVGYLRLKAGKHFLSDNLLGYAIGAGAGILVPQLHKKSNKYNISLVPVSAPDYNGALLVYNF
ncbi:phosphatase PAP2 family protein [Botryobacter ruber]|uniref:phosphatase PAP2 family protein n=1 Tax=Botryobacter ruber TaxID=2171629 RepID=UPI000E0C13A4|nr:phosphatase PAP2 family protein [Botryobacter ruber]